MKAEEKPREEEKIEIPEPKEVKWRDKFSELLTKLESFMPEFLDEIYEEIKRSREEETRRRRALRELIRKGEKFLKEVGLD